MVANPLLLKTSSTRGYLHNKLLVDDSEGVQCAIEPK